MAKITRLLTHSNHSLVGLTLWGVGLRIHLLNPLRTADPFGGHTTHFFSSFVPKTALVTAVVLEGLNNQLPHIRLFQSFPEHGFAFPSAVHTAHVAT